MLDDHKPPEVEAVKTCDSPAQKIGSPAIVTFKLLLTTIGSEAPAVHPKGVVKVKVDVPSLIPVTIPVFVMVATSGLLLTHNPPDVGVKNVSVPMQIALGPIISALGVGFIVISEDASEVHPVVLFV